MRNQNQLDLILHSKINISLGGISTPFHGRIKEDVTCEKYEIYEIGKNNYFAKNDTEWCLFQPNTGPIDCNINASLVQSNPDAYLHK